MAMICVHNSKPEDLHAGWVPVTRAGDYMDVFVVDADGTRIPWPDVSRINDDEMHALIRQIVDRPYTFHAKADNPALRAEIDRWLAVAETLDDPLLEIGLFPSGVRRCPSLYRPPFPTGPSKSSARWRPSASRPAGYCARDPN